MLIVLTLTLPLNANLAFATTGNQTNKQTTHQIQYKTQQHQQTPQ